MVNGALFLLAPTDPEQRKTWFAKQDRLPAGNYLVRIYVDAHGKLANDPAFMLGDDDLMGPIEIKNAQWQLGFPKAETVSAGEMSKKSP